MQDIRKIHNLAHFSAFLCMNTYIGITLLKFFNLDSVSEHDLVFLKIFLNVFFEKISTENLDI